jgi:uncharacterized alkaline shock family protein YloU
MAMTQEGARLPCGTPLERLIEQVTGDSPPHDPEHLASCAHCEAALATLRRAWDQLRGYADQPIAVPPQLGQRILSQLRSLSGGLGEPLTLASEHGRTDVGGRALAKIARVAALSVPGVAVATVVAIEVEQQRGEVRLSLRLAVELGPSIEVLATLVRAEVARRMNAWAGATATAIDIEIADVLL